MEMGIKIFTLEKANETLPLIKDLLHELRSIRSAIQSKEIDIDVAMILASDDGKKMDQKAPEGVTRDIDTFNSLVEQYNQVSKRFTALGCEIKGLDQGLVDFYTMHEGNLAYLCWKEGEDTITHWHTLEDGYANRQPL
jgi:hypothetical protein